MYTIQVPGKIILTGEHAVVYGKSALVCSINLYTIVTIRPHPDSFIVHFKDLNHSSETSVQQKWSLSEHENSQVRQSLNVLYILHELIHQSPQGYDMTIHSEIPIGSGLGSSASFSVGLAAALLCLNHSVQLPLKTKDLELISSMAFEAEKLIHGTPSGIDNTICTYGGVLQFKLSHPIEHKVLPRLTDFEFLIIDTHIPKNTKTQVEKVRHLHDQVNCLYGLRAQHPTIIQHLLNAIQEITKDMEHILQSQLDLDTCHAHLGSLMTLNHSLLTSLGVSHPTIDKIINVSQSHAAFCKMTGAGGGGCLIMLLPLTPADTLKDILRNMSCSLFSVKLGGSGIKVQ